MELYRVSGDALTLGEVFRLLADSTKILSTLSSTHAWRRVVLVSHFRDYKGKTTPWSHACQEDNSDISDIDHVR